MIRLLFLVILSSTFCLAQEQSALYKIEGNGLKEPSYLFGTINFLPQFGYFLPDEVKKALEGSDVFVTKLSLKRKVQRKFNEAVKIPNDGTVDAYLSVQDQSKLKSIIEEYGGKNQAYNNFYSRLQPVVLVTSTTALTLQYNIVYPERELEKIAKGNKLKLASLSNIDEEIEAFDKFPMEDQIEALKYMINNFDRHMQDYKKMVRDYHKEQNLESVKKVTFKATNESEAFKKAYYDDRTLEWIPEIKKIIKSKSAFIALGAPYLVGEQSLVELLRKEGYSVTPMIIDFVPAKTSN